MSRTDVRMSGFRERSTTEETLQWLDQTVADIPMSTETVDLTQATGRVLGTDVVSTIEVPGFDRSAMDGFAVRSHETVGATDYSPIQLSIIGDSFPGEPFHGEVQAGQAVRIMTGAPIPAGADAVVPAEFTRIDEHQVEIASPIPQRKNIGKVGEDIRGGATVLNSGRVLRPQDVGVLASIGIAEVCVRKRPHVRIIVTGNELALPGESKTEFQIYEANSFLLRGLITRDGGVLEKVKYIQDDRESIAQALAEPGADVILVSGGTSVGAEDFAPNLVRELGELPIHGIAMRPSSPTGLGRIKRALVCLLPGNPVSCLCAYDFFAGRAIRLLGGKSAEWPYRKANGILGSKVASAIGRLDYCRVAVEGETVTPLAISGASILSSTTRADGFLIVPTDHEGMVEGSHVEFYRYD